MNVPSIEDLAIAAHKYLIEKQKELEILKTNPLNAYIIFSKEKEIEELKKMLSKYIVTIREEKLKQLGI